MATYYPTATNHQRNVFPSSYLSTQQESQLNSLQESSSPPIDIMYHDHDLSDPSFLNLLSGQTQSNPQNLSRLDNHQELSLSLGMQISSSSMDLPSFQYNYLNPHIQDSSDHNSSRGNKIENIPFSSFDQTMNNVQCSVSGTNYQIPSGVVPRIYNSRYLKPSQEFLEEVVNIHEALRQLKMNKHNNLHKLDENNSKIESSSSSSCELSASEKNDLQNKMNKLFSMLDEVDRKYREYCQQLRIVEGSLDMITGGGAARSYTSLAHQTISRHFRCLRDTINAQIQVTRQNLGEQDDSSDRTLPRLRNVEKQLRQQRTLNPLGHVMRHSWRPQRGLPEGSVSILRAWLFEHFLNPYPKDSEKIMLARQTGLTRSQIANWFINARVRLWKPMVEDMYKEEFCDQELNRSSSPDRVGKAAIDQTSSSDDKEKTLQKNPNLDFVNDNEMNEYVGQRHIDLADQYRFDDPQLLHDFVT
ncbi:BEL1-like homeodomain protein 11 [Rutidosis leptorrhynchoides]|uniref:BEL1-like homeodomain protein 11 n=1 Tax=Rutidosis leptorrhynchoides TaxID=125765 RepID=UPI003A99B6C7